ncbi:MAG: hypothetical protein ACF8OB_09980 [Phycisphaeraceae bacterium JB051]
MAVNHEPRVASDYQPGCSGIIRQTCLEIATRLGDFRDQMYIVGGLVPSLIIDQSNLLMMNRMLGSLTWTSGFPLSFWTINFMERLLNGFRWLASIPTQMTNGSPLHNGGDPVMASPLIF